MLGHLSWKGLHVSYVSRTIWHLRVLKIETSDFFLNESSDWMRKIWRAERAEDGSLSNLRLNRGTAIWMRATGLVFVILKIFPDLSRSFRMSSLKIRDLSRSLRQDDPDEWEASQTVDELLWRRQKNPTKKWWWLSASVLTGKWMKPWRLRTDSHDGRLITIFKIRSDIDSLIKYQWRRWICKKKEK